MPIRDTCEDSSLVSDSVLMSWDLPLLFKSSHVAFLAMPMMHFSRLFFSVNFYFTAMIYYSKWFFNVSLLMLSFICMHVCLVTQLCLTRTL